MKLISLNIWGGHVRQPLFDFIKAHPEIDIFCLQEVYHNAPAKISRDDREVYLNIFSEIQALLPEHRGFFRPVVNNIYGIASFVRNSIEVITEDEIQIYKNPEYSGLGPAHSRNLQWLECRAHQRIYSIINIHGLWNGQGKSDSPDRVSQSKKIKDFVNTLKSPALLCGDFNLRPDTESLGMIAKGMQNLIESHHITSTRTSLYPKEERFADYIFADPSITIKHFEVLPDLVSDHSPLLVEFV
jgi:endonuclease/exonuclease/phosphatase family metal-dependent hydrolase